MRFEHGIDSTAFALAFCFSFLFWYDAANVRYEAGQHAKFLKKIGEELGGILDIGIKTPLLKERLGHTFIEVM
jgi:acid phosphatase family membrane protein YuiD